jgi:hypothetical protein
MRAFGLVVSISILAFSAFSSSASALPRNNGSQQKAAAGQNISSAAAPYKNDTDAKQSSTNKTPFMVKWESGKLSVNADSVPLSEVLLAVCSATGIEVSGEKQLTDRVSIHWEGADLPEALHDLLLHVDYAVTRTMQGPGSPRGTRLVIVGKSLPATPPAASVAKKEKSAPADGADMPAPPSPTTQTETDPQVSAPATSQTTESTTPPPTSQSTEADQQDGTPPAGDLPNSDASSTPEMGAAPAQDSNPAALADVADAAANQDRAALAQYMRDNDAAVQSAAFDAFSALDNSAAVQTLLGIIDDSSRPNQLQALALLSQSPQIDSQTVMTTLTNALNGGNPILSNYAAQALASLGTSDAMNAVNDAFNGSNTSGQLSILQSVSLTQSGQELLNTAVSGSNGTVSSAAATWLAQFQSATQQLQAPISK